MSTARVTCSNVLRELKDHGGQMSFDDGGREGFTFFKNEKLMRKLGESTDISGQGQAEKKQQMLCDDGAAAKEPDKEESYFRALDMLNDPPLVQASDREERYERPELKSEYGRIPDQFHATIVDFYRQGGHSGFLRRSRGVPKVVYHDGPDKIMEEARSTLGEIDEDAAKKHFSMEDFQFRWIHLPANNLEWMKDLTQRIYWDRIRSKDSFQDMKNFIWQSWYELPEGPSDPRYMKAGCKREAPKAGDKPKSLETSTTKPNDKKKDDAPASGHNDFCKVALYVNMPYVRSAVHTSEEHLKTQRFERFRRLHRNYSDVVDRLLTPDESHYESASNTKELDGYEQYRYLLELYEGKTIHGSRTLDESYYESISSIKMRNEDPSCD
ncbi:hypothetical protein GJ744_000996 [Endocarpon pusillum]|uniref:Uncharacterized protein n=1 Tax=Endocarpon pusillum TaxID=364733 RepID=A0A8H7E1J8_9EURO|nr:hypothetical protein GJ744_000996 [Endocarpon pusillum]